MRSCCIGLTLGLALTGCFSDPEAARTPSDDDDGTGSGTSSTSMSTASTTTPDSMSGSASSDAATTDPTAAQTETFPGTTDAPGTTFDSSFTGLTSGSTSTGDTDTLPPPEGCELGQRLVFLNFDGATLTQGGSDDAPSNVSALLSGTFPPYTGGNRGMLVSTVASAFSAYRICIVEGEPTGHRYDMIVITDEENGGILANSDSDCDDSEGVGNVAFAFGSLGSYSGEAAGYVVAKLIGKTLGLEFAVDTSSDIMKVSTFPGETGLTFSAECVEKATTSVPILCAPSSRCDGFNEQNSHGHLLEYLGPA